ncbi:hypothetical protein [Glycomyces buryatensis]|uniref:SWIM-type domain-containing protein n=1 Tax=Glycomyces buryatensis TaxID=2570927 RepID=A0A4S8Q3B5_9ACTN|nr:hypothetical protein [Glycomyces buryatensis]THV38500.1 hypothetical protein FAB82_18835 [Glycomyces buryatensis]
MRREDLLTLTPDSLAALANRGLVKRAAKELDAGTVPDLDLAADGTVTAAFPDGATTVLPAAGGLEAATCTCGAAAKCRHRVGAVLAYQRAQGASDDATGEAATPQAEPETVASPAAITDEQLRETLARHSFTAAEKARRAGYTARLVWPGPDRPAVAELPTCTVSFLVPGQLGYVHTDATGPARDLGIILAVWAFREATEGDATSTVGGDTVAPDLGEAPALIERVLLAGVEGVDGVLSAALSREAAALTKRRLHWPAGALNDLIDHVGRYRDRAASYDPQRFAALLAEIPARERASRSAAGTPVSQNLGTEETAETPLTLVRLSSLGCRIDTDGDRRTAEIFLAHPETGMVLTLRRDWEIPEDRLLTGHDLAGRRLAGCRLDALASGNVVSEAAVRTAARTLKVGTGRLAKTQTLPLGRSWNDLPATLRVTNLDVLARQLSTLPPSLIRARVAAESVRAIAIAEVADCGYNPATQTLEAVIAAPDGGTARVRAVHRPAAPGALEAIETALDRHPEAIAGRVLRHRGELIIEPTAILTPAGPVVPDLVPGDDAAALDAAATATADPVSAALEEAITACADLAHRGLRQAREPSRRRVEGAAGALQRTGLRSLAADFIQLSKALGEDDDNARTSTWTAAAIRTLVTAELH